MRERGVMQSMTPMHVRMLLLEALDASSDIGHASATSGGAELQIFLIPSFIGREQKRDSTIGQPLNLVLLSRRCQES